MRLEKENTNDFERQNTIGMMRSSDQAVEEHDVTHAKMMEFELLLEASGERNLRSINFVIVIVWRSSHGAVKSLLDMGC